MRMRTGIGIVLAAAGLVTGCQSAGETPAPAPAPAKPAAEAATPAAPAPAGMIVIEAEDAKTCVKAGGFAWVKVTAPAGYSGTGAMKAMPNDDDVNNDFDYIGVSPRMDYDVTFPEAGTYFVWVRGCGETEEDNSCHVGLDGKAVPSAERIAEFDPEWTWTKDTKDFEIAQLKIAAPGKRVLNIWMREDGFVIDKVVLTTDAKYKPTGKGP